MLRAKRLLTPRESQDIADFRGSPHRQLCMRASSDMMGAPCRGPDLRHRSCLGSKQCVPAGRDYRSARQTRSGPYCRTTCPAVADAPCQEIGEAGQATLRETGPRFRIHPSRHLFPQLRSFFRWACRPRVVPGHEYPSIARMVPQAHKDPSLAPEQVLDPRNRESRTAARPVDGPPRHKPGMCHGKPTTPMPSGRGRAPTFGARTTGAAGSPNRILRPASPLITPHGQARHRPIPSPETPSTPLVAQIVLPVGCRTRL